MGSTLRFQLSQALSGLRHSRVMALATITSIALALWMLGAFLLFLKNAHHVMDRLQDQYKLVVYLKDGVDKSTATRFHQRLEALLEVQNVVWIPKDKALEQVLDDLGQKAWVLQSLEHNPLPDAFEIKVSPRTDVGALTARLTAEREVARISSGHEWVATILGFVSLVRGAGALLVLILGATSLVLVSNAIWVTVWARRDEIAVMRLVGATNWFIRTPFLMEGVLVGLAGAVLAILGLTLGYKALLGQVHALVPGLGLLGLATLRRLAAQLVLMGAVLGFLGSLMSLRRLAV